MLRPFIVISVLSAATGALAEPVPLANDALKEAVSGSLVEIDTTLGTTLPIRFGSDGLVAAEAGALAPILGSRKDRGRWWVDADKLCTKWFRWFDAQVRCLTITQEGSRIYWRKIDDGETGTATLVERGTPEKPVSAPAVVANADPAPVATPPVKKVEQARETVPSQAPAEVKPAVVASVTAAPPERRVEAPAMRIGGAGFLDADRGHGATSPAPVASGPPDASAPAVTVKEDYKSASAPPAKKAVAPHAKPVKKPVVVAHLPPAGDAGASSDRAAQKRVASDKEKAQGRAGKSQQVAMTSVITPSLYKVRGVSRGDVLNVRRGPSETHASIAGIPATGRRVEITGQCQADWCPIRYGEIKGWVNSFYLAEDGTRVGSSSPLYGSNQR